MDIWEDVRRRTEALRAFNSSFEIPQRNTFLEFQRRRREHGLGWVKLHQAESDGERALESDELEIPLQEPESCDVGPDELGPVFTVGAQSDQE